MTLLVTYLSPSDQIIVADRRLTDGSTGKLVTNDAYKILMFVNQDQGYQFGVGFTGLASAGSFQTADWLITALPKCFGGPGDINDGVCRFEAECAAAFKKLPVAKAHKTIIFVFSGHLHISPKNPTAPTLLIVSNSLDDDGQLVEASNSFKHRWVTFSQTGDPAQMHYIRAFGDVGALNARARARNRAWRLLRRPVSSGAKLEIAARLVRTVGRSVSSSVGKDVLGLCLRPGQMAIAGEWPEIKGRNETLPALVTSTGIAFTHFSGGAPLGPQLQDFDE